MQFTLPDVVRPLVEARNQLRERYIATGLRFTFDGNLVGDIGEAIAAEMFGIRLQPRCRNGFDGHAPDGRTVQVKASASGRGPAFGGRNQSANHLLFFSLNLQECMGQVTFNGPESYVRQYLPPSWSGTRSVGIERVRAADTIVPAESRLHPTI